MDAATVTRRTLISSIILALAASVAAADPPAEEHCNSVRYLLQQRKVFPNAMHFVRTGPEAQTNRILAEIAIGRREDPRVRLNAMRAMEYFATRRSEEVLMTLLFTRNQRPAFKKVALRALARAFGVKMYFEILPFLRDSQTKVREGAALALGDIDDPRIVGVLGNHLVVEEEISVRLAIEEAIAVAEARNRKRPTPKPRNL